MYGIDGRGTFTNAGTIEAISGYGIRIDSGSISNSGSGLIEGLEGISLTGTLQNAGTIRSTGSSGYSPGVLLTGSATVVNQAGGMISAPLGVQDNSVLAGTIVNYGTISGSSGTAVKLAAATQVLTVEAGSTLIGNATGGGGTLAFGLGGGAGTVSALGNGGNYSGFGVYQVSAGANWTFSGTNIVASGQSLTSPALWPMPAASASPAAAR